MAKASYYSRRNRVTLVHNGLSFIDTCCRLVKDAQQKVLFHTYAFQADEVTQPFIDALVEKATEGVPVFILIDAVGSSDIPSELKARFRAANIRFDFFAPLISKRLHNVGRRLHQKVLVTDNSKALVGGINHSRHFIYPPDGHPWLDYAGLVEGEEVYRLQCRVKHLYTKYFPNDAQLLDECISPATFDNSYNDCVRANVNDFTRFRSEVYRSYLGAIRRAESRITIFATYFLPGKGLLRELKRAVRRGVCVELIFSAKSDHPSERWSSKYLYRWYLKHGIHVYEWDRSIVHGKVAIIDHQWTTLGSYNHNFLSRYVSLEMNLEVISERFTQQVLDEVEAIKSGCQTIDWDSWQRSTSAAKRFLYLFSYLVANIASILSTFILVRKRNPREK